MRKASVGNNDEYYTAIQQEDINLMRKAQMYLVVAPTATVGVVFLLNRLRYELLMSQHFIHTIKRYQEAMQSAYKRGPSKTRSDDQAREKNGENAQSKDIKSVYKELEREKAEAEKARQESLNQQRQGLGSQHQQPAMRNIDPFERKRRLAMQDKLSEDFSSRKVTSRREVNA